MGIMFVITGLVLLGGPTVRSPDPEATLAEILRADTLLGEEHYLRGRFAPGRSASFERLHRRGTRLHRLTAAALRLLIAAARRDGVRIKVMSGTRTFWRQARKWNRTWRRRGCSRRNRRRCALRILRYFAMPGTSRHHWGTDVDLCVRGHGRSCFWPRWWNRHRRLKAAHAWLKTHAPEFGFCQPYAGSPKSRGRGLEQGYLEEKWHWSFYPLSGPTLARFSGQLDRLAPKPGSFEGARVGASLYGDFVRNVACRVRPEQRAAALARLAPVLRSYLREVRGRAAAARR